MEGCRSHTRSLTRLRKYVNTFSLHVVHRTARTFAPAKVFVSPNLRASHRKRPSRGRSFSMAGMEGFGHVPRPRKFTIDNESSSERCSQTATGCFRPLMSLGGSKSLYLAIEKRVTLDSFFYGWDGGIRTPECRHQKPMPYHLATSQYCVDVL